MVKILSRKRMEKLLASGRSIKDYAVISFCDTDLQPIDYTGKSSRVFIIMLDDIGIEELRDDGLSYEQFFPEVDALAEFIYQANNDGCKFLINCEFGQSRSAGCAAAIKEHFDKSGIKVFANYKYYPNKLIYHKLLDALERYKAKTE